MNYDILLWNFPLCIPHESTLSWHLGNSFGLVITTTPTAHKIIQDALSIFNVIQMMIGCKTPSQSLHFCDSTFWCPWYMTTWILRQRTYFITKIFQHTVLALQGFISVLDLKDMSVYWRWHFHNSGRCINILKKVSILRICDRIKRTGCMRFWQNLLTIFTI